MNTNKINKLKKYAAPTLLICGLFFFIIVPIFSEEFNQNANRTANEDSLNLKNQLMYGLNKQQNIYNYLFNLNYHNDNDILNYEINQNYTGNTLISAQTFSKDEELLSFLLDKPLKYNISINSETNYLLISYPGSLELTNVERINTQMGLSFDNKKNISANFLIGPETNSQIGYVSSGFVSKFNSELSNFQLEGINFDVNAKGEMLTLDNSRENKELWFKSVLFKDFTANENIFVDFNYRLLDRFNLIKRDSIYLLSNILDFGYSVERRYNNNVFGSMIMNLVFFDILKGLLNFQFDNNSVIKEYNQYVVNDAKTGISQSRHFQKYLIESKLLLTMKKYEQVFGISFFSEADENNSLNKSGVSANDFERFKNLSFDLNMEQNILKLYGISKFKINISDSIEARYSASITKFDTPSPRNNSDRDELTSIFNLTYIRKLSNYLKFSLLSEVQLYHLVNLKSELSGSNYWMRTIRLAPAFVFKTKQFFMRPNFSILANYVIYDFEDTKQNVKSYSLRQLSYNDSISYRIFRNYYLNTKIDIIYKETGILYWQQFEEVPLNGNLRFFSRFFITNSSEYYDVSTGLRYYNLSQDNFANGLGIQYENSSFGPEVSIKLKFSESNFITFTGWYEFQYVNGVYANQIPNFFLKSSILL